MSVTLAGKLRHTRHGNGTWHTYAFRCPGCDRVHVFTVTPDEPQRTWSFNGDAERPTFTPSLMCDRGSDRQCHLYLTDGRLHFLPDCHHALAGQTVDLPDFEDS